MTHVFTSIFQGSEAKKKEVMAILNFFTHQPPFRKFGTRLILSKKKQLNILLRFPVLLSLASLISCWDFLYSFACQLNILLRFPVLLPPASLISCWEFLFSFPLLVKYLAEISCSPFPCQFNILLRILVLLPPASLISCWDFLFSFPLLV